MIGKWLLRLLIALFCSVIAVYLLVWLLSPMVVNHFANQSLGKFDLSLSQQSSIRYNPFRSRLSVDALSLQQQENQVLAIDSAVLEIDLYKLLWGEIHLKTFAISGIDLEIYKETERVTVAGFSIGSDQKSVPEQSSESRTVTPMALPYLLLLPQFTLQDAAIRFKNNQTSNLVEIKKLTIADLVVDQSKQQANIELLINIARGSVALDSQLNVDNGIGKLVSQVALDNISLNEFTPYLPEPITEDVKSIAGLFSLNLSTTIAIEPNVSADNVITDLNQLTPKNLRANGMMTLNKLQVVSSRKEQVLTQWDRLTVKGIETNLLFADIPKTLKFGTKSITFNNLSSSDVLPANTDLPPLSTVKKLQVSGLDFENNRLIVDKITIDSTQSNIIVGENKAVKTLVDIADQLQQSQSRPAAVSIEAPISSGTQSTFDFIVKTMSVSGDNIVFFRDESIQPIYERTLYIDKLVATNINSKPNERTGFSLAGRSNTYATIDLSGYVYPFSEKMNFHLEGNIKEVDLPPVSSYLQDNLGFELKSGDLDLIIHVTVTESELNGQTKLLIRGLETSKPQTPNVNVLQKTTPFSLNAALNFLKDKRGNITLDVPMQGSVDDPNFGMNSLIQLIAKKAAAIQVKRYALTFVPYSNVVSVAMTASDMIFRIRFEDLIFLPTQVSLEDKQQNYAQQFIALMKDRPKMQVKVCSYGVTADMKGYNSEYLPVASLDPSQTKQLRSVAKKRGEKFKEYVVKKGKIESSRILLCNPQLDVKENAKPRIEIDI